MNNMQINLYKKLKLNRKSYLIILNQTYITIINE